jgi:methylated-DNA-[protein]-cysteine S-methyltransferase
VNKQLSYTVFKTEGGWVGILSSSAGLLRTTLLQPSEKQALDSLGINDGAIPATRQFEDLIQRFQKYFSGRRTDFPVKLDLSEATPFQRFVWDATRRIPYGQTESYGWIAHKIGKPGAARAVGQALGKNPLPIIVPCHRVISSGGNLGGFSGGLTIKKRLLALEKRDGG